MKAADLKGTILRIEKISLNDGNGMRTVVFFKGCPCHCAWCSTPESQSSELQVYYMKQRCRLCGACIAKCPNGALSLTTVDAEEGKTRVVRDTEKCTNCMTCVDVCNFRAMNIYGKEMTVKQVMREIEKDEMFYFYSGGGVTLSGGDVFTQTDFAEALLEQCEDIFIDTCAELDMVTRRENVQRIIPHLNMVYIDIKSMDPEVHRKWVGVDNKQILENIKYASAICKKDAIHIRVPVVDGINNDRLNIEKTAEFCRTLPNCAELEFLPYHRLGVHTYEQLEREYKLGDREPMTRYDVYQKIRFLLEDDADAGLVARESSGAAGAGRWPFAIRISGLAVYDPETGVIPVTEEELKA